MTTKQHAHLGLVTAGMTGLLAMAAGLAVGHLVAGLLLEPSASPYLAVGNAAVDRTPQPIKDFAIEQFGTNDKIVLLAGMAVVLGLVAVVAGLMSRRRMLPGLVVFAVLGVIGLLTVLEQAGGGVALLGAAASLIVGVGVFGWLHTLGGRRMRWITAEGGTAPSGEVQRGGETQRDGETQRGGGLARRPFLAGSTAVVAGAAAAGFGGTLLANRVDVAASRRAIGRITPDVPAPPIPPGADFAELGTPTFVTPNRDFYRVDIALQVPQLRAEDARLRITGMVDREVELSFDDIRNRQLVERTITMTCVSNFVGGPYVSTSNFVGVPLAEVLAEAGVAEGATQLVGRTADGFTIGTPLDWVLPPEREAMLVIGMNREPLLAEHGFPLRTVVAGLYGYVSATKWLSELELTTFDFDPYWERRGWDGDPQGIVRIKTQARIDTPKAFDKVPAGEVVIAGIAWAQTVGIERVEVSVDGAEWVPAQLAAEVNVNTWRMWKYAPGRLPPGLHRVQVRATDKAGNIQTDQRANPINPGPDGATGLHSITFTTV